MKIPHILMMLIITSTGLAATGTLSSDSPCQLEPGTSQCTVNLSASAQNTPQSCLWRISPSLKLTACSAAPVWQHEWIYTSTAGNTFQLRGHNSQPTDNQADFDAGQYLAETHITAQTAASGTLSSDSPCSLSPGSSQCSVNLSASAQNTPQSCLWRITPSLKLTACSAAPVWQHEWTYTSTAGNTFQLRGHSSQPTDNQTDFDAGQYLAETHITAQTSASGTLSSDSPCTLSPGSSQCSVNLSATAQNTPQSCLWRITPDLKLVACSAATAWQHEWAFTSTAGNTFQLRGHSSQPSDNLSDFNAGTLLATANIIAQQTASTNAIGGSVFAWYKQLNTTEVHPDVLRIDSLKRVMPFGIIKQLHEPGIEAVVDQQLSIMYDNGQRRIGVEFYYGRGQQWINHGTYINSRKTTPGGEETGNVCPTTPNGPATEPYFICEQYITNFKAYLEMIKDKGFEQVLINFLPGGANNPSNWNHWFKNYQTDINFTFDGGDLIKRKFNSKPGIPDWQQVPLWQENWQVIKVITQAALDSDMDFIIDLQNESLPVADVETHAYCENAEPKPTNENPCSCENAGTKQWDQCLTNFPEDLQFYQERYEAMMERIWSKFRFEYGDVKTAGYSIIANSLWQIENRAMTMNSIYGNDYPEYLNLHIYTDANPNVIDVFNHAKTLPGGDQIIIGETLYNDMSSAIQFRDAQLATGANIEFIIQWNRSRTDGYAHSLPLYFDEYLHMDF
jgi:hypothetical protein